MHAVICSLIVYRDFTVTAIALRDLQPKEIRNIEGLSRFLLPSLFSDLQDVARDRAIIMLIASKSFCDCHYYSTQATSDQHSIAYQSRETRDIRGQTPAHK
ncbi:hypothetical protein BDR04DRAFT_668819 [Suillus decipiens]|nr:hypothetical protein BDR04DRAFT_668819 [Suillus decipiens]